jgi:hypothetical protein
MMAASTSAVPIAGCLPNGVGLAADALDDDGGAAAAARREGR